MSNIIDRSLAVLFDADNISQNYVKPILDACAGYGRVIIKRAYGDWSDHRLKGWELIFREFAVRPIQQYMFTVGKNITDSAMIIDAMDILHLKEVDTFVLASSDSDFTGLATRIREDGVKVIGVGRRETPVSFINACDEFLIIENLIEEDTLREEIPEETIQIEDTLREEVRKEANNQIKEVDPQLLFNQGRELLIRAIKSTQDENGLMKGAVLGAALRRIDPSFTPKTYGVSKLANFIKKYPDVIEIQGRRTATDPTYKSKI
jgi:uncharacterized LabA/DUF88 family protein